MPPSLRLGGIRHYCFGGNWDVVGLFPLRWSQPRSMWLRMPRCECYHWGFPARDRAYDLPSSALAWAMMSSAR